MDAGRCPRCKGSGIDPEDSTGAALDDHYGPEPPALEPCRDCQFPKPGKAPRELEDDAWGSVWLYGRWREITRQMTTPERELAADAVERWDRRIEPGAGGITSLRWWRD